MPRSKVMHPTAKFHQAKKHPGRKNPKVRRELLVKLGITATKRFCFSRTAADWRVIGILSDFAPWKPPFRYHADGQWIEDSNGERMLDVRGWGYLTGMGSEALGIGYDDAVRIQDNIGQLTVKLLNAQTEAKMSELSEVQTLRAEVERLRAELKVAHSVLEKLSSPPLIAGAVSPPSWDWQKQEETK